MSDAPNTAYTCISRIAAAQGGFVTSAQLHAAGVSRGAIEHQVRVDRLIRVYQGVYAVGHLPTDPVARAFGAQLALGDRSALAGGSACSFYGVFRHWKEPFELITPENRRPSGLIVRHSRTLLTRDVWPFDGLRVTSPARTALDIAPRLTARPLKRAVEHLRLHHHMTLEQMADTLHRNPRHRGAAPLLQLLGHSGPRPTRSDFEREFPRFAARFDLPAYVLNQPLGGYEVDVLFLPARLIVELDTFDTHLLNFASDRERDADLLARFGIPTIRLTWEAFRDEPARQAERIHAVLATR